MKVIAEIGLNHNGSLDMARRLIDLAVRAQVDYVKFQKRTPELCVPEHQKNVMRETPWGAMTYLQYRNRMEFGKRDYDEIDRYCRQQGIAWTASAWDVPSLRFLEDFNPPFVKIPSACATDTELLDVAQASGFPLVVSTGMCDEDMVDYLACQYRDSIECLMHCVSTYPSAADEQNLAALPWMKERYPHTAIGFSNHFPEITFIPAAVALGATWIEFHLTLDRSLWGSDQAASIEPEGMFRIMRAVKHVEAAMGDGIKRIYPSEIPVMERLRRH